MTKDNIIFTKEAAEIVGVKPKSVYTFIRKNNVKHGTVKMRGKKRLVVDKQSLISAVSTLGYDGSFDMNDIEWK